MKQYTILDLDNTICDDLWRYDLINWKEEDTFQKYHQYHSLSELDFSGNKHLFSDKGKKIIVFTARPESYREITERWLVSQRIYPVLILMREELDHSCSVILKNKQWHIAKNILSIGAEHIECAYDDREDVVQMYNRRSINAKVAFINDKKLYRELEKQNA